MSPPSTTHAPRSDAERNRSALLEAAADELARNPGASMGEIARAAHLTRATLYRHFSNRERLVEALQTEALERAGEALRDSRLDDGPAVEALHRAVRALAALGSRFRPLLVEGADLDPDFQARRAQVLQVLHAVVRRGQQEGDIDPDLPPEWVVTAMASMLAAGVRVVESGPGHADRVADLVSRVLVSGVGAAARN